MRVDLTDNDAERLTSGPTPYKTRLCTKLQIAHGRLMLTVLGGLAEFERELIAPARAKVAREGRFCTGFMQRESPFESRLYFWCIILADRVKTLG